MKPHFQPPSINQCLPQREQWAIISEFKAKEYEQLKNMERLKQMEKKIKFKDQLDRQMKGKTNVAQLQKEADRNFYLNTIRQAEEQSRKEWQQKQQKLETRRRFEEENQGKVEQIRSSRQIDLPNPEMLDPQKSRSPILIGEESARQRQAYAENSKKKFVDSLEEQIRIKEMQGKRQKQLEEQVQQINQAYMATKGVTSTINSASKHYGQNLDVYHRYQQIEQSRKERERALQRSFIEKPAEQKQHSQINRYMQEQQRKRYLTHQMINALSMQMGNNQERRASLKMDRPEDSSYDAFSSVFREKPSTYDKQEYSLELRRQAEEQKKRKELEKHMTTEEVRIHMQQLNKAVSGQYAFNGYQDRSLGMIGDALNAEVDGKIQGKEAMLIKERLESIKARPRVRSEMRSAFN